MHARNSRSEFKLQLSFSQHVRLISGPKLFSIKKIIFTPLPSVYCRLSDERIFAIQQTPQGHFTCVFCSLDIYILWAVTLFACMFAVIRAHKIDSALSRTINQILLCFAIFQSAAEHSSCVWKSIGTGGSNIHFPLQLLTLGLEFQTATPHAPKIISQTITSKGRPIILYLFLL